VDCRRRDARRETRSIERPRRPRASARHNRGMAPPGLGHRRHRGNADFFSPAGPEDFDYCASLYLAGMDRTIRELNPSMEHGNSRNHRPTIPPAFCLNNCPTRICARSCRNGCALVGVGTPDLRTRSVFQRISACLLACFTSEYTSFCVIVSYVSLASWHMRPISIPSAFGSPHPALKRNRLAL
jgi:hypothetical protein